MEEEYIFLFLWLDLRILIFNCKIRKYADYVYKVYTEREVTISMAAKKTRKRKTSSAAKKRTRKRQKDFAPFYKEIAVLVVFALFIFLFLSNFGICGYIGNSISTFFFGAFGTTYYIVPIVAFLLVILLISNDYSSLAIKKVCFTILLLCMISTIFQMVFEVKDAYSAFLFSGRTHRGGGFIGALIGSFLYKELGGAGSVLVVMLVSIISVILVTERSLLSFLKKAVDFFMIEEDEERTAVKKQRVKGKKESKGSELKKKRSLNIPDLRLGRPKPSEASPMPVMEEEPRASVQMQKDFDDLIVQPAPEVEERSIEPMEPVQPKASKRSLVNKDKETRIKPVEILPQVRTREGDYKFPPVSLLEKGKKTSNNNKEELRQTAQKLQKTLEDFGVHVTITNISCGPSVTQFELHPEQGVKVSKIVNLADDIKLNLAAADIRIEAPIPGKSAIGIEVPNKTNQMVMLRDLIENQEFAQARSKIAFAVGKNLAGQVIVSDIAKMPHLLIAGATGSGKSVCINTLIMSILYKATPEEVKLIMIDPKVVELSAYQGIPHLLIPVVTDPKQASSALNWAVMEMGERYKKFAEVNVRNLTGYNEKVEESIKNGMEGEDFKKLPQIVVIVDELADLMMVAPGEVEDAIVRLSQLARAAGIHLVIATQRPSVNVITGLIKANVPSRIAFSVSSGVDSRTIIDMNGAEKLLGKGDMLFYPSGYQKPIRVQGAFISDEEVGKVVEFLKEENNVEDNYGADIQEKIQTAAVKAATSQERDEYFEDAAKFIIDKDKASIASLQRVFKIGFNRAARLMDQLCEAGIVGEEEGTKPRKVLMSEEQFEQYKEDYL